MFRASNAALIRGRRLFKNWTQQRKKTLKTEYSHKSGKRKKEVGLIEPAIFTAFTTELCTARILDRELDGRVVKYNRFELENIAFDEKKFHCCFRVAL